MSQKTMVRVVLTALFTALSVVSILLFRIPLIPAAPFLEYDMADVIVLLCTLLIGVVPGTVSLLIVCLIQAFFMGGNGIIGFLMHFVASEAMVLLFGLICRKRKTAGRLALAAVFAILAMTLLMIPLNLVFTGIFMGTPIKEVAALLVPAIIPFNLLKAAINSVAAVLLYIAFQPLYKKVVPNV